MLLDVRTSHYYDENPSFDYYNLDILNVHVSWCLHFNFIILILIHVHVSILYNILI